MALQATQKIKHQLMDMGAALAPAPSHGSRLLLLFSLQFVGDGVHLRQAARIDGEACSKAATAAETLKPQLKK